MTIGATKNIPDLAVVRRRIDGMVNNGRLELIDRHAMKQRGLMAAFLGLPGLGVGVLDRVPRTTRRRVHVRQPGPGPGQADAGGVGTDRPGARMARTGGR
jgi:hypothetical protein